jgi:hypothetical protein
VEKEMTQINPRASHTTKQISSAAPDTAFFIKNQKKYQIKTEKRETKQGRKKKNNNNNNSKKEEVTTDLPLVDGAMEVYQLCYC